MSNLLKILRLGNPILRQVAKPFTREEIVSSQTRKLVKEMKEKMIKSDGVGLAAPQIGINKQLLVVGIEEDIPDIDKIPLMALFNPKLEPILKHDKIYMVESCLSVPDLVGKVPRYNNVIVSYLDEEGNPKKIGATGYIAGVFQHEYDHLEGKLFVDRVEKTTDLGYTDESKSILEDPTICWKGSIKFYDDLND